MSSNESWTGNLIQIIKLGANDTIDGCYVLLSDKIAIIDTGSSPSIANNVLKTIKANERDVEDINYIILTRTHPWTIGGLQSLLKQTEAKIVVHQNGKEILEHGRSATLKHQFGIEGTGDKVLASVTSTTLGSVHKVKTTTLEKRFQFTEKDETLDLGSDTLLVETTGGHSGDHLMAYSVQEKAAFVGGETIFYPNNHYSFFFDQTGSPNRRIKALKMMSNMTKKGLEILCSTHIPPAIKENAFELAENCIMAQDHTQQAIHEIMLSVSAAKTPYVADELSKTLEMKWKRPYSSLRVYELTVEKLLENLEVEGKVSRDEESRWHIE